MENNHYVAHLPSAWALPESLHAVHQQSTAEVMWPATQSHGIKTDIFTIVVQLQPEWQSAESTSFFSGLHLMVMELWNYGVMWKSTNKVFMSLKFAYRNVI